MASMRSTSNVGLAALLPDDARRLPSGSRPDRPARRRHGPRSRTRCGIWFPATRSPSFRGVRSAESCRCGPASLRPLLALAARKRKPALRKAAGRFDQAAGKGFLRTSAAISRKAPRSTMRPSLNTMAVSASVLGDREIRRDDEKRRALLRPEIPQADRASPIGRRHRARATARPARPARARSRWRAPPEACGGRRPTVSATERIGFERGKPHALQRRLAIFGQACSRGRRRCARKRLGHRVPDRHARIERVVIAGDEARCAGAAAPSSFPKECRYRRHPAPRVPPAGRSSPISVRARSRRARSVLADQRQRCAAPQFEGEIVVRARVLLRARGKLQPIDLQHRLAAARIARRRRLAQPRL